MGLEYLNWIFLVFGVVISAVIGMGLSVWVWRRPEDGEGRVSRLALGGRYAVVALTCIDVCELCVLKWMPERFRFVAMLHLITLGGFWSGMALAVSAVLILLRARSAVAGRVRRACGILLLVRCAFGLLFVITRN